MLEVYLIEAARAAIGRRGGALSTVHPADLLGHVQRTTLERAAVAPREIGQVVAGRVFPQLEPSCPLAISAIRG